MVEVKAKLWLEKDSRFVLGEGRAELLRYIGNTGSLTKAAKRMGMSYSHAWALVRDISEALGKQVVETSRGGASGGGSRLTKEGKEILEIYEKEMKRMSRHLSERGG